jgi:hypothetical protein
MKETKPINVSILYIRQPIAPAFAALSHREVELHESWPLKANKTTTPETDFDGPEQPSLAVPFGSKDY